MKTFIIILTLIACSISLPSRGQMVYQKGGLLANGGIGLGSSVYGAFSLNGTIEYFIDEAISLGGGFGYSGYNRNYIFNDPIRISVFYFGPRGSLHFADALDVENDQLDLYAGAFIGFGIVSVSYRGERYRGYTDTRDYGYDIFGGVRYQFNPKVAAYGELGFGISVLQFGASFML